MRRESMSPERAETLALEALGWLAGDAAAIGRFLGLSGMDAADLKAAAGSRDTAAAVVDFLLGDEELLLRFCAETGTPPEALHRAQYLLGGTVGPD